MAECPLCGNVPSRAVVLSLFWGGQRACSGCGAPLRLEGDWEMPAWRVIFILIPCTILAYFIVRPLNVSWIARTPIGIVVAILLLLAAIHASARRWPLTNKEPHAPRQYEPDVPDDPMPPPPKHIVWAKDST
jgi:hypothetical protein